MERDHKEQQGGGKCSLVSAPRRNDAVGGGVNEQLTNPHVHACATVVMQSFRYHLLSEAIHGGQTVFFISKRTRTSVLILTY